MVEHLSGTGITFCEALARLAEGKEMRRQQWPPYKYLVMEHTEISSGVLIPYIRTQSVQGHSVPWEPTQADLDNRLGDSPMNTEYPSPGYEEFVRILFKKEGFDKMLAHAARGVCTEAGEINDCVKKHLDYEQDFDLKNLIEEIGDMRFYLQALMNLFNISEKTVLSTNIKRLNKRYVGGIFTKEAAAARADKSPEN